MSDATGFTSAPERYTAHGRETIDRIRDELGDAGFRAFCIGNAMKYEDRAGRKGDPEGDAEKARWYRQMVAHIDGKAEDPRSRREGFAPYTWRGEPAKHNCWTCELNKYEDGDGLCCLTDSHMIDLRESWAQAVHWDDKDMPCRDSDGCPGWAPKTTT
jgi:hypothetical protein